jgi:hypothetical protein
VRFRKLKREIICKLGTAYRQQIMLRAMKKHRGAKLNNFL